MTDWIERAREHVAGAPAGGTDRTDKNPLLSVSSVPVGAIVQESGEVSSVLSGRGEDLAAICGASDPTAVLSRDERTDADRHRYLVRHDRLIRWGWSEADAEALAMRLARRESEGDDDRVSCTDCVHFRPGHCSNSRLAGLHSHQVSLDLAVLPQRCPGFKPRHKV
jgi:hypothetical protein